MSTTKKGLMRTTAAIATAMAVGAFAAFPSQAQSPGGQAGSGAQMQGRGAMMFTRCDSNDDGKISREEFDACHNMRFSQLDANGDGRVTKEEFQAQPMGRNSQRQQAMFGRMDKNGDGAITSDEFDAMSDLRFDAIDSDGDGFITQAEAQQMHQKMRGQGQGMGGNKGMMGGPGQGQGMGGGQGMMGGQGQGMGGGQGMMGGQGQGQGRSQTQ